jgi:hypothetical protein
MAKRLVPLLDSTGRWPGSRFPVPAGRMFRVENMALFYNPASGGTFSSSAIEMIK